MARATANCKCKECGTEFTKTKRCYNRREADNWEQWAESNFTLCPSCWGKAQRAKRDAEPITFNADINPFNPVLPFVLHFSGGTREKKDEIKELGYSWGELPVRGLFGALDTSRPPMGWYKLVSYPNFEKEVKRAEASGIAEKVKNNISKIDLVAFAETYKERQAEIEEKTKKLEEIQAQIDALEKPIKPATITDIGYWNGKVYGKKGYFNMYVDNIKIDLSDDEAAEIKNYQEAVKTYKAKVAEIKKEA